ncbi:MAG: copper chaperone PCu(A)C [Acetobacteraceae bacterium]|nr:copper chaperone PCu(A)C [Acetobacteraceae bacterium]
MLPRYAALALLVGTLAAPAYAPAHAQPVEPGTGVIASQAWSRATSSGADTAAVYVTLKAPVRDALVGITTPEAKKAEIHQVVMDGNVMIMRELPNGLQLPPGQPVSLQPGGYHIMLTGLSNPLKLGQTFPLHLTFQISPPIDITARVAAIGASIPPAAGTEK